jgi:hypothetical protein
VQPKDVNRVKGAAKGEICPGGLDDLARVKPRADASVQMTEGKKAGAAIASFRVAAMDPSKVDAWSAAFVTAIAKCKAFKSSGGTYDTTVEVDVKEQFEGADEVRARLESIYAERTHRTLYYVREVIKVRYGRYVVTIEHAFIQPKTDPKGADWTKTAKVLRAQVAKARTTLNL